MTVFDANACLNKKVDSEILCILKKQFCPTADRRGLFAWSQLLEHRHVSLNLLVQMEADVSCGSCAVNHRSKTMLSFPPWCSFIWICLLESRNRGERRTFPSVVFWKSSAQTSCSEQVSFKVGSHSDLGQGSTSGCQTEFTGFGWCFQQFVF